MILFGRGGNGNSRVMRHSGKTNVSAPNAIIVTTVKALCTQSSLRLSDISG
jgi:hypothetical protein